MAFCPLQRRGPPTPILPLEAGQSHMDPTLSFRALGEPGTRRVPAREPCDPESMSPSAPAERWIPDSAVCRSGFLRNPGQTGFRNDEWEVVAASDAIALRARSAGGEGRSKWRRKIFSCQ